MPATSSSTGAKTPVAPVLADELALERLFRAQYPTLVEEAKTHLEDAASSAPKVVEGAYRSAWQDRYEIATPAALDSYLHEAVKHGAARERARRVTAHRFSGTANHAAHAANGTMSVDDAWTHLHNALHPAERAGASRGADALRHDAAAHMKDMAKRPNWIVPAIIVAVALLIALGGIWWFDRLGEQPAITSALVSPEAKLFASATSQIAVVTLDDGTKVTLAPESKLTVPKKFSGKEMRAVKIEGAATFEVAPNQEKQFQVRAGPTATFATGTQFTVFAYPLDSTVTVHVKEGAVTVGLMKGKETHALAAGKALFLAKDGTFREPTPVELGEATSWTSHRVILANRQLRDALQMFKRWYGMDIKVPDLPLLDRPVAVDANLDSSRSAIAQVEQSANVKFGWEGQNMLFADAAKDAKKEAAPAKGKAGKKKK